MSDKHPLIKRLGLQVINPAYMGQQFNLNQEVVSAEKLELCLSGGFEVGSYNDPFWSGTGWSKLTKEHQSRGLIIGIETLAKDTHESLLREAIEESLEKLEKSKWRARMLGEKSTMPPNGDG